MNSAIELLDFKVKNSVPLVMQVEAAECGLACIAMIANYFNHRIDMRDMRKSYTSGLKGMTLKNIIQTAESMGMASRPLQASLDEVEKLQTPCILHWDMDHFVVLVKVSKNGKEKKYVINDPATGKRIFTKNELNSHFTGICLELTPTSKFREKKSTKRMDFTQLWSSMSGLGTGLTKLFLLSLILQIFSLLSPYYMQMVVDEVLISFDKSLLIVLAIGFGIISVISVVTTAVRSWLILRVSSLLNMQMASNLLHHLLRLPMKYFEGRHIGDIVSRFGSLSNIQERITTGFIETLVDGIMATTVLIVMIFYSLKLTLIITTAVFLYLILRLAFYRSLHQATEETIQSSAKEQSYFLEGIRGIQTVKLFNREAHRQSVWQNHNASVINSGIKVGRLNIGFKSFNGLIFGLENIIVIYVAATMVMANSLSVGMVLAFLAYKAQFTSRLTNLIEQIIQFKMMRLHLERISDIALTEQESKRGASLVTDSHQFKGELKLESVSFGYSSEQALILDNISITINSGESIAITGSSGAGKTTLLKVMLGLLEPTEGKILLDGIDITHIGLVNYRKRISAIMQEDTLFSGSIAENICFFDPQPDVLKIENCAKLSSIHDEIIQMSMGYNSLVGDMGSNLSGGQIQRVLVARALYHSPSILFLDEATSHLDGKNESEINKVIKELTITKVSIAHRQETLDLAEKVYKLEKGSLILQ